MASTKNRYLQRVSSKTTDMNLQTTMLNINYDYEAGQGLCSGFLFVAFMPKDKRKSMLERKRV